MTSDDDPRTALQRELYWAEEAAPLARMTAAEARDALHDFAGLIRHEERELIPHLEPNLAANSRWRRQVKLRLFRLVRPVSRRYDRLLGDLAELTALLARRLAETEAEVARLRALVEGDGGASTGEDEGT